MAVEVVKAAQDLPRPLLQRPQVNVLVFLPVPGRKIQNPNAERFGVKRITEMIQISAENRDEIGENRGGRRGRGVLLAQGAGGEDLRDEIDVPSLGVDPGVVELDDVLVFERLEQVDLGIEALHVF